MVMSGFDYAPTKRIGVMLTPWMMGDELGLVKILQVHK